MAKNKRETKRQQRRVKRRVKTSVKKGVAIFLGVLFLGLYIGVQIWQAGSAEDPFGDVRVAQPAPEPDEIEVEVENVSYTVLKVPGEAILIKVNDKDVLIDTGSKGKKTLSAIKDKIDGDIEYLILSSDSPKRIGGFASVAAKYHIKSCIIGDMGEQARDMTRTLKQYGVEEITEGKSTTFNVGDSGQLSIIKPAVSSNDKGDKSLVTLFESGELRVLALSDAGREEIQRAIGEAGDSCTAVVLSRFGSEDTNRILPDKIQARYFVASAGKKDGVPSDTLKELFNGDIATTGMWGDIYFKNDEEQGTATNLDEEPPWEREAEEEAASEIATE